MLAIEYHVYIWQASPQLSCGDTCHIWMWFKESNRYFCKIENFAYWEINERSFSKPLPRWIISHNNPVLLSYLDVFPNTAWHLEGIGCLNLSSLKTRPPFGLKVATTLENPPTPTHLCPLSFEVWKQIQKNKDRYISTHKLHSQTHSIEMSLFSFHRVVFFFSFYEGLWPLWTVTV